MNRRCLNNYSCIAFSLIYALILSSIPHEYFKDRPNYLLHIEYASVFIDNFSLDFRLLFGEPLFVFLNGFFSAFLIDENVIRVYVFFIAYTCSFMVYKYSSNCLMLLLGVLLIVFIPNMWSLQLGAIRQGLAASFIYWGFYLFKRCGLKLYLTIFLSSLIHVGGFLVFAVVLANSLIKKTLPKMKLILRIGIIAASFSALIFLMHLVLPYVQSKHSGYFDGMVTVGGGLFVFYLFIVIMVFIKNKYRVDWTEFEFFGFLGVVTYLSMYFITPMSGRWLDFFVLPFIMILISRFSFRSLVLVVILLCVNVFLFFNGGAMNIMNKPLW